MPLWDIDGNEFIEYGIRAPGRDARPWLRPGGRGGRASDAARHQLRAPGPLELELAEQLLALVPAADMVKFAKNGSDATTAA